MMRAGLVSFGQGLYFCIGAYVSGLMANGTGITDIFLLSALGIAAAAAVAALFGPLLATYRGIFFAMLTLSLSMILYGFLSKMTALGGTDGLNVMAPTFLGYAPEGRALGHLQGRRRSSSVGGTAAGGLPCGLRGLPPIPRRAGAGDGAR